MIEPAVAPPRRANVAVIIGILALVAVAATATADRLSPARPVRPAAAGSITPGGVWACPVVSLGKAGGALHLVNGSVNASSARVRWIGVTKPGATLAVAAGHSMTLKAPADGHVLGAVVEWVGGDIVASRSAVAVVGKAHQALAGGQCSETGSQMIAVPGLRTLASESQIWILNPAGADAVVDISFALEGDEIRPETLRHRVVPARSRLDIRAGDFVFDKRALTAVIRVATGTVVADGTVINSGGADLIPGRAPVSDGVITMTTGQPPLLAVTTIGDDPATIVSSTLTPRGQAATASFPPVFEPDSPGLLNLPQTGPLAVSLTGREGSPFVAQLSWSVVRGSDFASIGPSVTSNRWLGVAGSPFGSQGVALVVSNPSPTAARISARLFTSSGQVAAGNLASITIAGGTVSAFGLGRQKGPVGVEVVADHPVGFALLVAGGDGRYRSVYATLGMPTLPPSRPAIVADPRAGVSAPD
ncbi:MAG: DUF5719 family protein [Actinomycetota bacterium]|nr:DUF5719 family protein [Actinomycetota bacterium]